MDKNHIFIASNFYSTINSSSGTIFRYELATCTTDSVPNIIAANYSSKSVASLSELFCPYSTITDTLSGIPSVNLSAEENLASGDSVIEMFPYYMRSGINTGICPTYGETLPNTTGDIIDNNESTDIRSIAIKTPIMMAGFGYTTEGLPTPSLYDQKLKDDSGYIPDYTTKEYDRRQFASNVRERVDLWNAGPLDVRWDENRHMFISAPEVFVGYTIQKIPASKGRFHKKLVIDNTVDPPTSGYIRDSFGSGEIEVYNGRYNDYCSASGSPQRLLIINRSTEADIESGIMVVVTRTNNGEYMPIYVDCDPDTKGQI